MVAWIETIPAKDGSDSGRSAVLVKDLREAGAAARTVMDGGETVQGLTWSRDGKLAFVATADSEKQLQLYVADKPGHAKPRRVTNVEGFLADPHWSPDGSSIAILWMEGVTHIPGPTEATIPDIGVVASQIHLQRLALVNPATGAPRVISPDGMHVYECDWSPDGKELAYLAAPGPGDDNWYVAELYAVDAQSRAVRHILKPSMQVANVRWSPDGKTIAFIGGLMSDEGSTGGDIYALPAAGGAVQDLTPQRKSSPNWFRLDSVFQANFDDRRRVRQYGRVDAGSGVGKHRDCLEGRGERRIFGRCGEQRDDPLFVDPAAGGVGRPHWFVAAGYALER